MHRYTHRHLRDRDSARDVTKLLIKSFYNREQSKSYFAGCSTAGRMAAMEAQRFPNDFDGIISGA
jgi:hypothetical protein